MSVFGALKLLEGFIKMNGNDLRNFKIIFF